MRYLSDDGKVFNTELECSEYEKNIKRLHDEEEAKKEKLERERKEHFNMIMKKRKELLEIEESYRKKYNIELREYLPFGELARLFY